MNRTFLARLMHHGCRGAILAGFATYILLLARSGSLEAKVEPEMTVLVKLSAMGLYALAICQLLLLAEALFTTAARQEKENCGCGETTETGAGTWLKYSLFLLPLLLGMIELWKL